MTICEKLFLIVVYDENLQLAVSRFIFIYHLQQAPVTPTATTTKVKIGMIAPLTSDVAALGEESKAITEYVLPSLNENTNHKVMNLKLFMKTANVTPALRPMLSANSLILMALNLFSAELVLLKV